jgi:hypothetical protein
MSFGRMPSEPQRNSISKYCYLPKDDNNITPYEIAQVLPIIVQAWIEKKNNGTVKTNIIPASLNEQIDDLPLELRKKFFDAP